MNVMNENVYYGKPKLYLSVAVVSKKTALN